MTDMALDTSDRDGITRIADTSMPLGVAVSALIVRQARVLMLRRPQTARYDGGNWEFPGGKLDAGETLEAALEREVGEETGLRVAIGAPLCTWNIRRNNHWVTGVLFECQALTDEVHVSGEHRQVRWVELDEISDLPLAEATLLQLDRLQCHLGKLRNAGRRGPAPEVSDSCP